MTTLVEKILTLRTASMFSGTSEATLAEVAAVLDDIDLDAGELLFAKGETGDAMYIVAYGRLRVHDGTRTIDEAGEGQIIGEMAVIDSAPRLASVTALEESHLLRLDQETLFELMADHSEVLSGILSVLLGRLRAREQELGEWQSRTVVERPPDSVSEAKQS